MPCLRNLHRLLYSCILVSAVAACAPSLESQLWSSVRRVDTVPAYRSFLQRFPDGDRAARARARLTRLEAAVGAVSGVRLDVEVRYVTGAVGLELDGVEVPMRPGIETLLGTVPWVLLPAADDRAAAPASDSSFAVLRLDLQGRALHQGYAPSLARGLAERTVTRQYAGAQMSGSVALLTGAGTVYARDFTGRASPPARLGSALYPSPQDAPFDRAFDEVVLPQVARLLGELLGPAPLLRALDHETPVVRAAAAWAFGDRADTAGVAPLLALLASTPDFRLQVACARALGDIGDGRAAAPLVQALGRAYDVSLRAAAADALGRIGDPCAVEPLLLLLEDAEPVREAARRSLRRLTGEIEHSAWVAWREGQAGRPCGYDDGP